MADEQTEFASLLFGSAPEVPAEVSAALLDQTFAAGPGDVADDSADLVPADFDALDDGLEAQDDGDGFADDVSHGDWAAPDAHDVHRDLFGDLPGEAHDGLDEPGFDADDHHHGDDWSGDLG